MELLERGAGNLANDGLRGPTDPAGTAERWYVELRRRCEMVRTPGASTFPRHKDLRHQPTGSHRYQAGIAPHDKDGFQHRRIIQLTRLALQQSTRTLQNATARLLGSTGVVRVRARSSLLLR